MKGKGNKMASSTCVKYGSNSFEVRENTPSKSNYKPLFVQSLRQSRAATPSARTPHAVNTVAMESEVKSFTGSALSLLCTPPSRKFQIAPKCPYLGSQVNLVSRAALLPLIEDKNSICVYPFSPRNRGIGRSIGDEDCSKVYVFGKLVQKIA